MADEVEEMLRGVDDAEDRQLVVGEVDVCVAAV